MYDIFYLKKIETTNGNLIELRKRFPLIKVVEYSDDKFEALNKIKQKSITKLFWVIDLDIDYQISDSFNFDYVVPEWDKIYVHIWKKKNNTEESSFGNVYLISKDYPLSKKEGKYFFFINKKEIPIEASRISYDVLELKKNDNVHDKIVSFQNQCNASMFWVLAPDCRILGELNYVVPDYDKEYVHQWTPINHESPNLFLIPKEYPVSKREAEHLFFISKKEMDDKISKVVYDKLQLEIGDNFYDRITSFQPVTSMFWVLAPECKLLTELDYVVPDYDKEYVHQWTPINHESPNLFLIPKDYPITKREARNLFFISKKEMDDKISKIGYDILQLELGDNFHDRIVSFRSTTSMFWVLAPECKLLDELTYLVPEYDKEYVHQWTPINHESPNLFLIPKLYPVTKKEADHLFFISKKEMDDKISKIGYDILQLEIGDNFYKKISSFQSTTSMFWVLAPECKLLDELTYLVPDYDKDYVHQWTPINHESPNLFLIPKLYPVTSREARNLFFISKKEMDDKISKVGYDILKLNLGDDPYDRIISFQSTTSMFWVLEAECKLLDELTYLVPDYDKDYVHQWTPINRPSPNLFLIPKDYPVTKKEADHLFFISKKEMDDKISKVDYSVLILELGDNFYKKISSFQSTTSMFWVLAPECKLLDELTYLVPDYDKEYVHQWTPINHESPNLFLIPKDYPVTKKEADHLFFISKKEMDDKISKIGYDILQLDTNDDVYDCITSFQSTTSMFWVLTPECKLLTDLTYLVPDYDKDYVHQWTPINHESPNLFLIPKHYLVTSREAKSLFFINKKEMDNKISKVVYDTIQLSFDDDVYERITSFQSTTSMFWVLAPECKLLNELDYVVPNYDKEYVHQWTPINHNWPNLFLIPKNYTISKRESKTLFFINKKEMDNKISKVGYDILELDTDDNIYDRITSFQSTTSMFWVLHSDSELLTDLTYLVPDYDKEYVHQWNASNTIHSRLNLIPKTYPIAKKEADNLFFINKKEMLESLFKETYDIIFISYKEPNAEDNWMNLKSRFPQAKRVHGIEGIHNAHIQAAKISTTSMFWVIDGDSQIVEDFNLDYVVNPWDKDSVFVWKSKNSVNDLVYGYGGVKLFPKKLTLELDTSTVDMSTSISKKFNPMDGISNLTIFNTDPFNTWKSAFRECVKMSSKVIDGQIDNETEKRLDAWCTIGSDKPFGEYSIKGAMAGKEFGLKYYDNKSMLSKINDWEWLNNEFNKL